MYLSLSEHYTCWIICRQQWDIICISIIFKHCDSLTLSWYKIRILSSYCSSFCCVMEMTYTSRSIPAQLFRYQVTHWGRDKMATIFQTTFSNAFSWMKMFKFRLRFHWSLFPRVQLTIFQHRLRWWIGAVQATSHYLNHRWLVYRRVYASFGLNELIVDDSDRHYINLRISIGSDNGLAPFRRQAII